jgi:limonene 1,2-monooxygenase
LQVHLAETREQAYAEVRERAGAYWRDYFEDVMGFPKPFEAGKNEIVEKMVERGSWCIGTPDDLIAAIEKFDAQSGGFGGLLVTSVDWATREQIMHSYELIARYVKPRFQGSLVSLTASEEDARRNSQRVNEARVEATTRAREAYQQATGRSSPLGPSR